MTTESQDRGHNLVFQEVSHPGTDQAQPCLASVGNQSWAAGWYGCWYLNSAYNF